MRILGLDVGEKRIGVAKVDTNTRIAVPVGTILVDGSEWQEIARLSRIYDTTFFVLGLPRSNEGNETAQSLYVRNFAKTLLNKNPNFKVRFQDESLTSVEAEKRLKSRKKGYQKGDIDAEAASIILQDFVENFKENSSKTIKTDTNLIEKQTEKAMLKSKKAVHKSKKLTRFLVIPPILIFIAIIAVVGVLVFKEYRARQRAEEYAKLEAEMQAEVFNFTIKPGETIFDIKENLAEAGYSASEIEAAFNTSYDVPVLAAKPAAASLEGFLMGETYEFYKSDPVTKILETFLKNTDAIIRENNLEAEFAKNGLSLYEGITLASLVQKEVPPEEQPTVAQVFYSRLEYGWRLGSDASVTYARKVVDPEHKIYTNNTEALTIDSCYNTRIHTGLPCGPVANPSVSALMAVAYPTDTNYLFFLTGDDGITYYSYTEEEHLQKVSNYCKDRCNIDL